MIRAVREWPIGGIVVQRHPNGQVRVFSPTGVVRWDGVANAGLTEGENTFSITLYRGGSRVEIDYTDISASNTNNRMRVKHRVIHNLAGIFQSPLQTKIWIIRCCTARITTAIRLSQFDIGMLLQLMHGIYD